LSGFDLLDRFRRPLDSSFEGGRLLVNVSHGKF
jgi:hypothetical protein